MREGWVAVCGLLCLWPGILFGIGYFLGSRKVKLRNPIVMEAKAQPPQRPRPATAIRPKPEPPEHIGYGGQ